MSPGRALAAALTLMMGLSRNDPRVPAHEDEPMHANHLAGQTSPYLLQHQFNPVDWYPWGEQALAKAKAENKPIFLSIGYAACHWCHVMEHESFENEAIAALLNASFVAIKVDREERPDLDDIYMTAVQSLTGQGGWPLNVFLTPDGRPFYGGTYFPPDDRMGRASFPAVLSAVRDAWASRHDEIDAAATEIASRIAAASAPLSSPGPERAGAKQTAAAVKDLASRFDASFGGFSPAPKFPPHASLALLLRAHAGSHEAKTLNMVTTTLDAMARGGMYDHVGGGFARYSTDRKWLVPHFEKMLYDQALLVPVYVDAWRVTGRPVYRRVVEDTLDFVRREMTSQDGGLYASLDADSEGHEGAFYVWTPAELTAALGPADAAWFAGVFGVTADGNFEGKSIPNLLAATLADRAKADGSTEDALVKKLAAIKPKLLAARGKREHPATDDKILTSWNGLMISAFAKGYEAFGRPDDLTSARRAADFVLAHAMRDGRLLVSYRAGQAHLNAYLDDYAFLSRGLVDLYEAGFDRRDLDRAAALARTMLQRFGDGHGGFHFTSDDHEALLARTRSTYDGAIPAGSAVAVEACLRLAAHLDDAALRDAGLGALAALRPMAERAPSAFATLLNASAYADPSEPFEITIVGPKEAAATARLLAAARARYLPARALAFLDPAQGGSDLPLLAGKTLAGGKPTAYVCRNRVCGPPLVEASALTDALTRRLP